MSKIEKLVQETLSINGISCAPVPVEFIAGNADAKVSYETFDNADDISGMLFRDENKTVIAINSNHSSKRQRFTIAHELGHFFLHTGDLFVDRVARVNATTHFRNERSSLAVDKKEIQANNFAANLLMPKQFIYDDLTKILDRDKNISTDNLIEELSALFEVSSTAMGYRLENLGILVRQD